MYNWVLLCVFIVNLCGVLAQSPRPQQSVTRLTNYGIVEGKVTQDSQVFLGVPFAQPPARWESPQDPTPWKGVLLTKTVKPMCYQNPNCEEVNPVGTCLPLVSEDCLYLNIYAPVDTVKGDNKAVMFFIHGGGFEYSSGGADVYNGEMFVKKGDVILVTINYRLGAFGFLVTGNGPTDIRGNYGLQDQRHALKWVHENIANFGGDLNRITMFGQSAGAQSIAIHMTNGKVDRYFHRAIIQSSPFTIPLRTQESAEKQGAELSKTLNCYAGDVACLKSKTPDQIASAQGKFFGRMDFQGSLLRSFEPWLPHIDGDEVPLPLIEAFKRSAFSPKATMLGTTVEEGKLYVYLGFTEPMPHIQMMMMLFKIKPSLANQAYNRYRPKNNSDVRPELAQLTTDFVFACPTRAIAREIGKRAPVYTYVFNNAMSMTGAWNLLKHCEGSICHGVDIPYVFQSARGPVWQFTRPEVALSDTVIYYWTNFAKTGNPSRSLFSRVQFWPPFTLWGRYSHISMVLSQRGNFLIQRYAGDNCDFWDQTTYTAK